MSTSEELGKALKRTGFIYVMTITNNKTGEPRPNLVKIGHVKGTNREKEISRREDELKYHYEGFKSDEYKCFDSRKHSDVVNFEEFFKKHYAPMHGIKRLKDTEIYRCSPERAINAIVKAMRIFDFPQ